MKIENFANAKPEFNLMEFFEGKVQAWGIVEDRFGNLRRQFTVDMTGVIENDLTLEEDFVYADGEIDKEFGNLVNLMKNLIKVSTILLEKQSLKSKGMHLI